MKRIIETSEHVRIIDIPSQDYRMESLGLLFPISVNRGGYRFLGRKLMSRGLVATYPRIINES
jgi:hypothetical protein